MTTPVFISNGNRLQSASAATLTPVKPTVMDANGLLVCLVQSKNNDTHSTATSGWTKFGQQNSGVSFTASVFTARSDAANPVITWASAASCAALIFYYGDGAAVVDTVTGATSVTTGTVSPHTSTAITTTRNNSLAIYLDAAATNTFSAIPSGWAQNFEGGSNTDDGRNAAGSKPVVTSGTSSGAISVSGAVAAWVQWQIEILQALPTAGLQASKAEVGAWYSPPPGLTESKQEVAVWYAPPSGLAVNKVEVGMWLALGTLPPDPTPSTWVPKIMII